MMEFDTEELILVLYLFYLVLSFQRLFLVSAISLLLSRFSFLISFSHSVSGKRFIFSFSSSSNLLCFNLSFSSSSFYIINLKVCDLFTLNYFIWNSSYILQMDLRMCLLFLFRIFFSFFLMVFLLDHFVYASLGPLVVDGHTFLLAGFDLSVINLALFLCFLRFRIFSSI